MRSACPPFAAADYCDMAHKAMPVKQPVAKTQEALPPISKNHAGRMRRRMVESWSAVA
ncbi:hypothetical protein CV_2647 [Chromobacterium violaceum ATCC 12472]|uniref:Uncharacterized protein n=1 Tax=Chromobacterium violaceum (strain ATCC 12472 / DSM 30191 / JCM 1249 / CCUG 213 / NBRC 12614 / NCIMB 9131 / NCTC 9757 / MK) TaxID=243365 RepID=Q7NUQ0_CHRVO|nr:hypothetical protein CV_2647 [Chromobacterium violaceum ATCC 12472]